MKSRDRKIEVFDSALPRFCGVESLLLNAQNDAKDLAMIPGPEAGRQVDVIGYDEAELLISSLRELRREKGCACMQGTEIILNCEHLLEALHQVTQEHGP